MAYVGFDLDETIGQFQGLDIHTYFLQPQNALYKSKWSDKESKTMSKDLEKKLEIAFQTYIDCLVKKVPQLIRPSMIEVAKELQNSDVKSVVIYSNNSNLSLLHLGARMVEKLANVPDLFDNYIHWYHPFHTREQKKTLAVLQKAFYKPVPVEQLYFFDDLVHPDLLEQLGDHYTQVEPYKFVADPELLNECFLEAFLQERLFENEEYLEYMKPFLETKKSSDLFAWSFPKID